MKRWMAAISLVALSTMGLVTGCATQSAPNQNNASAVGTNNTAVGNTSANQANNATTNSANGTGNGTAQNLTPAQLKTIANQLLTQYVNSHNDKTMSAYKVDVQQFLIPGLATAVGGAAKEGVDYNHPIQTQSIAISDVQSINYNQFHALAEVNIQYKDGTKENVTYHVMFMQDPNSSQWLIRSIG